MNYDMNVGLKLMGSHLGAQKGAWVGPPELLEGVSIPILGFHLRSQGFWLVRRR
jgi:hypothetical protein